MHFSFLAAALALASQASAINILLGNDDGFGSAQIRETYRLLKAAGHNVVIVSEADNQSGMGGRAVFTNNRSLVVNSEYNLLPAGSPSFGHDINDPNIFYYNGTPAATAFVGIDYVVPTFTNWTSIDLVVAGPNFGTNLGPFLYTLSGTAGYTYASVGRDIPGIAFSGGNSEQRSYQWINQTTPSGYPDPATIQAQLAVQIVSTLVKNTPAGQRLLPSGYGISVNTPFITSLTNASCVNPPFVQTRLTGNADYDKAVYNATSGLFTYANIVPNGGGNTCINGDCSLPGETAILNSGCQASVSVFTVDYDAPTGPLQADIRSRLSSVVKYVNGTGPSASTSVSSSVCPCASSSTLRTTISGASGAAGSSSHSPSVKATGSSSSHSPNVKATGSSSSHSSSKKATSSSSSHSPSAKATGSSSSHSAGASPSSHTTSAALPGHGFSSSSPAAHSPPGYDPAPTYAYHERARDQY